MKTTSEIVRLSALVRLEEISFTVRKKTDKGTGKVEVSPLMELKVQCEER